MFGKSILQFVRKWKKFVHINSFYEMTQIFIMLRLQ